MTLIFSLGAFAGSADVQVTVCPNNSKVLLVQIRGESAVNIFRALAHRIKIKPSEMLNTLSNGMNCEGLSFFSNGDVQSAKCSFLMLGQKNIPYPQIDAGFGQEEVINCE